jgi:membrane protein
MVQVHKIYGSVAVLPIVLTWIYISWYIALVGCRLCYALDASRRPDPHPDIRAAAARETFVARLMIALVQLHRDGHGPLAVRALVNELGATRRMVREGLQSLAATGLAVEAKEGGWLPGRDAARVTLAQVRAAARSSLRYPSLQPDRIAEAVTRAFGHAEGAAEAELGESLDSFLRRLEDGPAPKPLVEVGQGGRQPA